MVWPVIAAVVGGVLANKGAKDAQKRAPTPEKNLLSQAKGARDAAEKYGFNPLTMLQYGQTGGAMGGGGGAPALASVDYITDAIRGLDDVFSGDKERRRAQEELNLEIARVNLDRARAGAGLVTLPQVTAADRMAASPAAFGRPTATYRQSNVTDAPPAFGQGENPIAPGRKKDVMELPNSPGVFEIENKYTYGAVTVPGDSEPWGLDELATAAIIGGPQVAYNYAKGPMAEKFKKRWTPDENSVVGKIKKWWSK